MAQLGLRWLAFGVPKVMLDKLVPEQGNIKVILMLLGEKITVITAAQRVQFT